MSRIRISFALTHQNGRSDQVNNIKALIFSFSPFISNLLLQNFFVFMFFRVFQDCVGALSVAQMKFKI